MALKASRKPIKLPGLAGAPSRSAVAGLEKEYFAEFE
jgi:hypothetical protein